MVINLCWDLRSVMKEVGSVTLAYNSYLLCKNSSVGTITAALYQCLAGSHIRQGDERSKKPFFDRLSLPPFHPKQAILIYLVFSPFSVMPSCSCLYKPLISSLKPERKEFEESVSSKDDNVVESRRLLPSRNCGISKGVSKTRRKVQWNDINGNKLAEVVEFQVSDGSDSNDDSDSCFCTIM